VSDISKTGIKFSDRVGWQMPEEPFHLDLEEPFMLDLPPPKSHIRDKTKRRNITSDIYNTQEQKEARAWIEFNRPDIRIGNRDPRGIKRLIECNAMPERKPKAAQKQMIVDNKLVPYDTKWNRYTKYQEMLKNNQKLSREQIIDWAKMWPVLHRKEASMNKIRNYKNTIKERKVQQTSNKLDYLAFGFRKVIQEIRQQNGTIQEINQRAKNDSILKQFKQPISNLWHAETKH